LDAGENGASNAAMVEENNAETAPSAPIFHVWAIGEQCSSRG
jgi:hypothetical protein